MKKKTKHLIVVLIICIGVLAILLGLLYVTNKGDNSDTKMKKTVDVDKDTSTFNAFVNVKKEGFMYRKKGKKYSEIGRIGAGVALQLENVRSKAGEYTKIKDSEYYIASANVQVREEFKYEENYVRYLPFNENIVSRDNVKLYDENGTHTYTLKKGINAPIYAKKNDMNFVVFNHDLYGIKQEDTESVVASANTDQENATKVPVFMYHFFYDSAAGEVAQDNNFRDVSQFRNELTYAKENGFQSVKMKDLDLYLDGAIRLPQKSFVISMDDNAPSVKNLAYPVLESTQTYATNFVITSWIDDFVSIKSDYIELQSHSDALHTGGCRGMGRGGALMCIGFEEGVQDLTISSQKLYNANVFCYPFGDYNDAAIKMLEAANYSMAFTVEPGYATPGMNKLLLPRVRMSNSTSMQSFVALLEG